MITALCKLYIDTTHLLEKFFMPFLVLGMRIWMARIFWYSGLTKISSWQGTVFLFKNEYKVPIIPPEIAAYMATTIELVCPVLLVFGLATRFATLPMLAMAIVIQLTYAQSVEHIYWGILLLTILFYGPGWASLDHLIKRKCYKG